MYTVTALVTFIIFISGSNSVYGTSDVVRNMSWVTPLTHGKCPQEVQVVGIAFNLIIIRANKRAQAEQMASTTMPLEVLRRPMVSDSMDGVRVTVTVMSNQFNGEGVERDGGGKRSHIFDHTASAV
jgi:hypothetical protein